MTFPVPRQAALSSLALAVSATLATLVAASAHAQSAADPALASVLVTASRTPQAAVDVLSDHVVISAEEIERSGATTVTDLLQKQRGIEVTRNGGPGTASQVYIRGGDARQNVVLVDGVRIGSSTTGIANWAALPLANVERIEIIYGPMATMYGADAIGGVVQIFTRRGAGPAAVQAGFAAGSDKARAAMLGVSGASEGDNSISYAFTATRDQDEGFSATRAGLSSHNPDADGYKKDSVAGSLNFVLARGHEAGLIYLHSHLKSQYDAGATAFDARSVNNLDNIALYSRHQLTPDWRLTMQATEADDKSLTFANASATGTSRIETRQHNYSIQNDIAFGSDLLQVMLERREEAIVSSSIPVQTSDRSTNSIALAYSLKRGAHLGSASLRRDDSSVYGAELTGGLAYGYRISQGLRANVSAGTSFRAPTFNELYFPNFGVATNQPEKGKNAEAGLYYNRNDTEVSAVYYRNRLNDLLVTTTVCPVRTDIYKNGCAYNVSRASLDGLSIGGRTRIAGVDLHGSVDFQDPTDETTGKSLIRRSRRHAKLGAEYASGAWTAGVGVHASGRRFDDSANRNSLGGYGVLNLYGAWRFTPEWSAVVKFNNVTDKKYELARFYNTAGSHVFAGLRYGVK